MPETFLTKLDPSRNMEMEYTIASIPATSSVYNAVELPSAEGSAPLE